MDYINMGSDKEMKKVELLVPVGNRECLEAAVNSKADAVYLSGKNFGARKFAGNFTNQELVDAIEYCHLYGVKVYVTVNTIIYQNEVEEVLKYLEFLYQNRVDAVIMQDLGIISIVRKCLPGLEIHASTQCHNHNDQGLKIMQDLGVTRVVLDREMSLEEIKELKIPLEKEVFVHGALCVCYSGCCLFSSLNGGRSGNRGECVQSCRLPYKFLVDGKYVPTKGKYLLSTRELNTMEKIKDLIEAGIDSFKIEGRMKSASYVALVTSLYRKYIDNYYENKDMTVSLEDKDKIARIFNRKFTTGYLNKDKEIMNIMTSNHQGVEIGEVIEVNEKKIVIKLKRKLRQNDGIRFKNSNKGMIVNRLYNKKDLLVRECDTIAVVPNKIGLDRKDIVSLTYDSELDKELNNYLKKKIGVKYRVKARKGSPLEIELTDYVNVVKYEGDIVEESVTSPISREKILLQLSKLGDSIYLSEEIDIEMDEDIFIRIATLNEARRYLVGKLNELRIGKKKSDKLEKREEIRNRNKDKNKRISILVRTEEQLKTTIGLGVDNIYVTNLELYRKYEKVYNNIYFQTSRVSNKYPEVERVLVTDLGGIEEYKDKKVISDYYFNVVNNETIKFLQDKKVERITLAVEDDYRYVKDLDLSYANIEMVIYGRLELMIMKYCPIKQLMGGCNNCRKDSSKYCLEDNEGNKYPILKDDCYTKIMHSKNIDKRDDLGYYISKGVNSFRIELLDESSSEVEELIRDLKTKIDRYGSKEC